MTKAADVEYSIRVIGHKLCLRQFHRWFVE